MAKRDKPDPSPAAMAVETFPIDELHQDPANARKHDARNLAAIKASLARFGQVTPIVIDANNVVRKGNGTLMAARELGWGAVRAIRTTLGGVDATAYAIADNRTAELAGWDDEVLAETLEAIRSEPDYPIEATGFEDGEVEALLARLGDEAVPDFDPVGEDEQGRLDEKAKVECPNCGHEFTP